jgi:anti-sigma regulatory factor (Ser/Thr protein kinase)
VDALTGECLPISHDIAWIPVEEPSAVGRARRTVAGLAERLAFPPARTAELEIAVSELGSNLSRHAEQGVLLVRSVHTADEALVEVVTVDRGPGIPDVGAALRDGHSTAGTLGIGLGAVHRLADSCEVVSSVGTGTVLVARFRPHRGPTTGFDAAAVGVTRPITGEDVCGDGYAVRRLDDRLLLMMCDGAGHGPLAATASRRAVRAFCDAEPAEPDVLVRRLDVALVGSRGGAVAVADLRPAAGTVRFAGVGNIAGAIVADRHKRGMVSLPGIAGHRMRALRVFDYELPPGATVVLHSDGLTDRWTADTCDGMLARGPLVLAMALLRAAGTRRDDASVLVARSPR